MHTEEDKKNRGDMILIAIHGRAKKLGSRSVWSSRVTVSDLILDIRVVSQPRASS